MATAPILIAASELLMMPLMHVDRSPPVIGPTLMVPCPPTLGRDSHLEYPSGPRVSTQQRTSWSWPCIHNREKKPNPTIAAINSPATVGRQRLDLGIVDIVFVGARVRFERSTNTGTRVRKLRERGMRGR